MAMWYFHMLTMCWQMITESYACKLRASVQEEGISIFVSEMEVVIIF